MTTQNNDVPAFPCDFTYEKDGYIHRIASDGMTLRQYAAIKLRVPDSGTDWLDEMIVKSKRDDFAAKAMQGVLSNVNITSGVIVEVLAED